MGKKKETVEDSGMGCITIAPEVVSHLVVRTVEEIPGVVKVLKESASKAVIKVVPQESAPEQFQMEGEEVLLEVHLAARDDVNLRDLGARVQSSLHRVVEDVLGLKPGPVNVYIDEITLSPEEK
jgi:uncharacterized alkaline shock family protein YloU